MSAFGREQRGSHLDRNSHADETAGPVQDTPVAAPYGPDDLAKRGALANRASLGDGLAATLGGMSIASGPPSFAGPVIGPIERGASNGAAAAPPSAVNQPQGGFRSGAVLEGTIGGVMPRVSPSVRLLAESPLAHPGRLLASGFFGVGDFVLHHGGQVALDIGGFVPGVNVITEGAQAGYHGLHAAFDASEGNSDEENEELVEAAEHAGFAALNLFSGEAGAAANAAEHVAEEGGLVDHTVESCERLRSRMQAGLGIEKGALVTADAVHNAHTAFDVAETGWDTTASVVQGISGTHVPFVGSFVPWMLDFDEEKSR